MMCAVCGGRAVALHHLIYKQHLRGADPKDRRNLLPICQVEHERHHSAARRIPLSVLPDEAFEFAREVLGLAAFDYFTRRYFLDDDDRLYELLEEGEAV